MSLNRHSTFIQFLLIALPILFPITAGAQTQDGIFGILQDDHGAAAPGISLSLTQEGVPTAPLHATTDTHGAFQLDALPPGTYRLSIDTPGYLVSPDGPLTLSAASPSLHLALTLTRTGASPTKPQSLQLQAAGIRGYIDPGGYSAPAGAAAASKLIQNAADLNRTNTKDGSAAACERESGLLKAVRVHPENAAALRDLGDFYLVVHQPAEAVAVLQRARLLNPLDQQTYQSLAEAFLQTRQFAAAHDLLTAKQVTGTNQASIHRLLARSDEGLGAFREASSQYQAAAGLEPSEADFYGAGYELILAGSAAEAVKAFQSGMARYPQSVTLLMGLGTADFLLGQSAEATHLFLRCAILHPTDARLYPFLSASYAISGVEPAAVEAAFHNYYDSSRTNADAAYFYALVLLHQNVGPAISPSPEALLKRAIEFDPAFAKAHLQLGSIYFDRGEYPHAADEFAAALRLDPSLSEVHYRLSQAYRHAGQSDLAAKQMKIFLATKDGTTAGSPSLDIHLEQFLSVFDRPTDQHTTAACPTTR